MCTRSSNPIWERMYARGLTRTWKLLRAVYLLFGMRFVQFVKFLTTHKHRTAGCRFITTQPHVQEDLISMPCVTACVLNARVLLVYSNCTLGFVCICSTRAHTVPFDRVQQKSHWRHRTKRMECIRNSGDQLFDGKTNIVLRVSWIVCYCAMCIDISMACVVAFCAFKSRVPASRYVSICDCFQLIFFSRKLSYCLSFSFPFPMSSFCSLFVEFCLFFHAIFLRVMQWNDIELFRIFLLQ